MKFLVLWALKRPKLFFWELSKTVIGFFVAQLETKLSGGGSMSTPPPSVKKYASRIGLSLVFVMSTIVLSRVGYGTKKRFGGRGMG